MKKISYITSICFLTALFLFGCNSNKDISKPEVKPVETKQFLNGPKGGTTYYTIEIEYLESIGKTYSGISEDFTDLLLNNFTKPENGNKECLEKISTIIMSKDKLNETDRIELQFLCYMNLDFFIRKLVLIEDRAKYSKEMLESLFKYTEPIEWRVLGNALKSSHSLFNGSELQEMKNYIIKGIKKTSNSGIVSNAKHNSRLSTDGQNVLEFIKSL